MTSPLPTLIPLLALALLASLLASCANQAAGERRTQKNPELYEKLTEQEKALVGRGEIAEGMSTDAVFLSWGKPDRVRTGSRNGQAIESWAYFGALSSTGRTVSVGVGNGGGIHPRFGYSSGGGWNYGTDIDFTRPVSREVNFVEGRVISWERVR